MSRKSRKARLPQRKKPYRAKKGRGRKLHRGGRRWCICSQRNGTERKLRRLVVDTLTHLRGHTTGCDSDCECLACTGDSFNPNGFSDREAGKRFNY
jgi:hypothetical protein